MYSGPRKKVTEEAKEKTGKLLDEISEEEV
jgi:hypothetical protein